MEGNKQLRKVYLIEENVEREISMSDLNPGDFFKLKEPDGTPVTYRGTETFKCAGKPYLNEHKIWTVNIISS
jgi:hypothetical protein